MGFKLLKNRNIIDILIGDKQVSDKGSLPYLSGPKLCELCTTFGLPQTYNWSSGGNKSRWEYMTNLVEFLDKKNRVPDLLSYLFDIKNFNNLTYLGDPEKINNAYKSIIDDAIKCINANLMFAGKELRLINKSFVIVEIGQVMTFESPILKVITSQYIKELPDRIKDDLENKNYDSVITKSRTLLEEVLIYIIEHLTYKRYESNGDLIKIYQEATSLLNMRQNKDWDKRINELLGGLHKLVSAISSMRNINSDAHGAGSGRLNIKKRDALLVAHSSMIVAEYLLCVYENK